MELKVETSTINIFRKFLVRKIKVEGVTMVLEVAYRTGQRVQCGNLWIKTEPTLFS